MEIIHALPVFFRGLPLERMLALVFILFFALEWLSAKLRKLDLYDLKDSLRNLGAGLVSLFVDLLFSLASIPLLDFLFTQAKLFEFPQEKFFVFLLLFVLIDFSEYWFHRLSHEINFLWAAHSVHHQSTYFNLSVGLRTSFFVPLFNIFFYLPLPLLGFAPDLIIEVIFLQGVYQLLVHTKLVGKLGWLEYIFVTPSAHRVHHGRNKIYLDRNYGKTLIIWDRLFSTYEEESEEVEFGLTQPLERNDVLYSIFEPFRGLLRACSCASSRKEKLRLLLGRPGEMKIHTAQSSASPEMPAVADYFPDPATLSTVHKNINTL